jgi:hypothetical protein
MSASPRCRDSRVAARELSARQGHRRVTGHIEGNRRLVAVGHARAVTPRERVALRAFPALLAAQVGERLAPHELERVPERVGHRARAVAGAVAHVRRVEH